MPEGVEDKIEAAEKWYAKFQKKPITAIIAILMSMGTLGVGAKLASIADPYINDAVIVQVETTNSDMQDALVIFWDSLYNERSSSNNDAIIDELTDKMLMFTAMTGKKGLSDEGLMEEIEENFDLADSLKVMMPALKETTAWVEVKKNEDVEDTRYVKCGYVLYDTKTKKPRFFVDCDKHATLREIKHGRPSGVNLNSRREVFYYRNSDDKPIILSYLSNY